VRGGSTTYDEDGPGENILSDIYTGYDVSVYVVFISIASRPLSFSKFDGVVHSFFHDSIDQLVTGPVLALEVTSSSLNTVLTTFLVLGPWDVDMARELLNSIRARFEIVSRIRFIVPICEDVITRDAIFF
jgi:hypothetical protein